MEFDFLNNSVLSIDKAVEILKTEYLGDSELMELAKQMGVASLKKHVKTPVIDKRKFANLYLGFCPNCDNYGVNSEMNYCDKCGQALDWNI